MYLRDDGEYTETSQRSRIDRDKKYVISCALGSLLIINYCQCMEMNNTKWSNYIPCFLASCSHITMVQYATTHREPYLTIDMGMDVGCAQTRPAYCGHTLA
jgi:hypothetical protein